MIRKTLVYMSCLNVVMGFLGILSAFAKDYYVSPNGNGNSCEKSRPCDLPTGLQVANSRGDTVILLSGTYRDRIITVHDHVTIRADQKHKAVVASNESPVARIKNSGIVVDGIHFDARTQVRGLALEYATQIADIVVKNCIIQNTKSAGINLILRNYNRGSRGKVTNVTIQDNIVIGTGHGGNGEAVYIGSHKPKKSGGSVQIEVENVEIVGNRFSQFTDNCIDVKQPTRNVQIYNNTCENQIKGKHSINHGTVILRGYNHKFYNNHIHNVLGGQAVFNIAARGGHEVYNNTIIKSIRTAAAIKTRELGLGNQASEVSNNTFSQLSSYKVNKKFGLIVQNNQGLDD